MWFPRSEIRQRIGRPVKAPWFALGLVAVLSLSACSQDAPPQTNESTAAAVSPSVPAPEVADPCAVIDSMQQQFAQTVAEFTADPSQDAIALLEQEFSTQVALLYSVIDAVNVDQVQRDQLSADLTDVIANKDDAVRQFNESTETDNFLQKGVLLAGAAVAAQQAVATMQSLLSTVNAELSCTE